MTLILPEDYAPEVVQRLNEETWLECGDPFPMLHCLTGEHSSNRKLRLFAVACCRRIWHLIDAEYAREAVEFAERLAEGQVSEDEAHDRCLALSNRVWGQPTRIPTAIIACFYASSTEVEAHNPWDAAFFGGEAACAAAAGNESGPIPRWIESDLKEAGKQADLLRCIFGNPFRPIDLKPEWQTPTVLRLAAAIYEERAFDRLPILADALEDAGCASQELLRHCRDGGDHVRGCWALDLVLGKS